MILDAVHLCYDPIHHPFASEGAVKIEDLDSERPASKIIRAVLRYNGIDAAGWESYSLHKCYCRSEAQEIDDVLDPSLTLEELEIKGDDCVFIREVEIETQLGAQDPPISRSSRKRKRDYHEDSLLFSTSPAASRSSSRGSADQVSNLENLTSQAAKTSRSISKLLGGDGWKTQPIGKLGPLPTKGNTQLQSLLRLVKTSLEIPQLSRSDRSGLFNSDLVEALIRAYQQRIRSSIVNNGRKGLSDLGRSDYEQANELLKGKIRQDACVALPLSNIGLSGYALNTARAICVLWKNDKWINQTPMPGLSPISLKENHRNATLRQIAELTRVKPGEATPDGFPLIVLRALKQAIQKRIEESGSVGQGGRYGWTQSKDIPQALEILKTDLKDEEMACSTSSASTSVNEKQQ